MWGGVEEWHSGEKWSGVEWVGVNEWCDVGELSGMEWDGMGVMEEYSGMGVRWI